MNLFDPNGHLSPASMQALLQDLPDELQRLEAAEHLAFCDECLLRYTELAEAETLLAPEKPLAPAVLRRLPRTPRLRVAAGRYATAAASVLLAVALWATITLTSPGRWLQPAGAGGQAVSLSAWLNEKTFAIGHAVDDFWNLLFAREAEENEEEEESPLPPSEKRPVLPG